jgi:deoxyribodipyrimidine photo-lyase
MERFLSSLVDDYASRRNDPGADATRRLSPYLKWGCLHPRQLLRRLDGAVASHDTFAKELAWRDFYADVLEAWPDSARRSLNEQMAGFEVDTDARSDERFAAWCEGRTGFPIVDAGMRQLLNEGWMHNRLRMITASFLVKDLHVDWFRGARFFSQHLVDADLSSNNHGWQWVAGTGTDAAPFFRIFNPTTQGQKFDPEGTYVKRWVPELATVATKYVHEPSRDPDGPPSGYPPPIVDHRVEREESLRRYAATKR